MTGLTSPPNDENRLSHPRKADFHIVCFHGKRKQNPLRMNHRAKKPHLPVMLKEVAAIFEGIPGGPTFIDATVGAGGHCEALLEILPEKTKIIALDKDLEAIKTAKNNLQKHQARIDFTHSDFKNYLDRSTEPVAGILMDLGVSSMMLDNPERGFSFSLNGPLDMRMDQSQGENAAGLVERLSYEELREILWKYGEERFRGRIARNIISYRETSPITTTGELAGIISQAIPKSKHPKNNHPATRSFMALRIAVNQELSELDTALKKGIDLLVPGGRMAVISFHSLEDRIVKQTFAHLAKACICPPEEPVCRCLGKPKVKRLAKKPIKAGEKETRENPRARSALLRAVQRL